MNGYFRRIIVFPCILIPSNIALGSDVLPGGLKVMMAQDKFN